MDAERWLRLSPLLDALLELEPSARQSSLASLREDDPGLAAELEQLLALEQGQEDFLDTPLVAPLPGMRPGIEVGPYRLERMLGEGGMGQVWLASRADGLYQRRVALKLLRPGLANPGLRLRFTREREILARLEHTHIARLLDAGISADNQPYLALDYVDGEPISDWCARRQLEVRPLVQLFLQVCDAVSHAHANLIVHRDLKPSNILVTPLDEVRLLDFGIAKLLDSADAPEQTRTGARAFTLHYAAPEQIRGEPVSTLTDVYSLGVVLYELLAGTKPYVPKRPSDAQWEEAILASDPVRPSQALLRRADAEPDSAQALQRRARAVAGDLDNIVLKALGKRYEHRYASVEAMALDLQRYLEGRPVLARPQRLGYRAGKFLRRHRWPLATALFGALALSAALGLVAWQSRQSLQDAGRAQAMQNFVISLFQDAGDGPEGAPLDVRQLLEAGVERGEVELAQQPVARAGLLGVIARLRLGLGDHAQALELLRRQAALLATVERAPASLQLDAATDLGKALRLTRQPDECIAHMRPLQNLARREERRLPRQATGFYSQLGRCHRDLQETELASALFRRSLSLRRDRLPGSAGIAENMADLAGLDADAGRSKEALKGLTAALAQLQDTVGDRHPMTIRVLRELCSQHQAANRHQAALGTCARAATLSTALHGAQHRTTLDAQRDHAALLAALGRYREAAAIQAELLIQLRTRLGQQHPDTAAASHALALTAWEQGQTSAALAWLDDALPVWRTQSDQARLADALADRAMILLRQDHPEDALAALDEALPALAGSGDRPPATDPVPAAGSARILRLRAEAEAALGRMDEARDTLFLALQAARRDHGPDHPTTQWVALSQALLNLRPPGQPDPAAIRQLEQLAGLAEHGPTRTVAWLAQGHLAAAACTSGPDTAPARQALRMLDGTVHAALPEGGAIAGEIRELRQVCEHGPPDGHAGVAP